MAPVSGAYVMGIKAYWTCCKLTETGFGFGHFMNSICEFESDFAKPSKPAVRLS